MPTEGLISEFAFRIERGSRTNRSPARSRVNDSPRSIRPKRAASLALAWTMAPSASVQIAQGGRLTRTPQFLRERINRPRGEPFGVLDGSARCYGITANAGSFDAARLGDGTGAPDSGIRPTQRSKVLIVSQSKSQAIVALITITEAIPIHVRMRGSSSTPVSIYIDRFRRTGDWAQ
jgi:hypothetical protein